MLGRPSTYTPELADQICDHIAHGLSLRQIGEIEEMPAARTIRQWLIKHDDFVPKYARAKELQMEHYAEEILEISDDGSNDWMKRQLENGEVQEVVDHEHVTRSRLRVDTRKWLMSKLAPKKYGDKLMHSGPDGEKAPVFAVIMNLGDGK